MWPKTPIGGSLPYITSADFDWKWQVGSIAMWDKDNYISAHRVIPGKYKENRRAARTTVFGERPYFDRNSEGREGREEREERLPKARGKQFVEIKEGNLSMVPQMRSRKQ